MAFPSNFASKRYFYASYTNPDLEAVVSRFFLLTNSSLADPASEQVLLRHTRIGLSVNSGHLRFGPDGYLYVGFGDNGFLPEIPRNFSQDPSVVWGKILRIDVESSTNAYRIPPDNPFVGVPGYLPEIWALGLRNPWRFSFDRLTGDFFVADVGQIESEEINYKAAAAPAGLNYGWPVREGNHDYMGTNGFSTGPLASPVVEYRRGIAPTALIGGFVYRGAPSRMAGLYFYAEAYTGKIFALSPSTWDTQEVGTAPFFITTFGEDNAGNLYLADYVNGTIYQMDDSGAAAPPTFDPSPPVSHIELVTVSSLSPGVIIHYTMDGSDPDPADPSVFSGGVIAISSGTTLKARAFRSDLAPSSVSTATYTLKAARPAFTPPQGPLTNGVPVVIHSATPGATVRYTLDGAEPTASSPAYIQPIPYTNGVVLKARAFKSGFEESLVAEFMAGGLKIDRWFNSFYGLVLKWNSVAGLVYQIQVGDDLVNWRDLWEIQPGTGGEICLTNYITFPPPHRRFHRLCITDPPGL